MTTWLLLHCQIKGSLREREKEPPFREAQISPVREVWKLTGRVASSDAVAQPVAVEEKKGLSNIPLISVEAETYEGKEETPVDVIKDKAKDDLNLVIPGKERVDINDDEIEEKSQNCPRENSKN
ncbi:hypothetical protein TNCV_768981 [Trichonephila clavipes]|nr:hypothetical protein TNCV_768981 [Trichonephila clavipes]